MLSEFCKTLLQCHEKACGLSPATIRREDDLSSAREARINGQNQNHPVETGKIGHGVDRLDHHILTAERCAGALRIAKPGAEDDDTVASRRAQLNLRRHG